MKNINIDLTVVADPAMVNLISPMDSNTDENLMPTFSWNVATNATSYELQIATDAAFTSIAQMNTEVGTTHNTTTDLMPNTIYYWRVRGKSSCDGA